MAKRIGEFFVEKGVLDEKQVELVLEHSRASGLRFGDAALQLGVVTREQMIQLFGPNFRVDFFNLDPKFYPRNTADLLKAEEILELGALPLGVKTESSFFRRRRCLNIGMLDPSRKEAVERAFALAKSRKGAEVDGATLAEPKVFLVLADQYLAVLRSVYGVADSGVAEAVRGGRVDPVLSLYAEI